jgi:hypothetical protein
MKHGKAEVAALLSALPGDSPRAWLRKEIKRAKGDAARDVETLCAALERHVKKRRKSKTGTKSPQR